MTPKRIELAARDNAKSLYSLMNRKGWGAGEMGYNARRYAEDDTDLKSEQNQVTRLSLDYLDELIEFHKKFL